MAGFFTVGIWTLLSRVIGFVRDIMMASYLGTGPVAETFLVAFSLPNMFRRFFAEGAFNMAFVPMFSKKLEGDDDPAKFAQDAFVGMAFLLTVFTTIGIIAMARIGRGDGVWGSWPTNGLIWAVTYGRIAFPYILSSHYPHCCQAFLNATGRFAAAAAAPVLLNVIFIAALIITALVMDPTQFDIGTSLAWAVPIGGVAQLGLVFIAARRAGFPMRLRLPKLTSDLKHLALIAAPAALAGGVLQINLLVGRQVASFFGWRGCLAELRRPPVPAAPRRRWHCHWRGSFARPVAPIARRR